MKPLSVGIDFRPALSRATGVGRYFQGLVSGLAAVDRENDYVLFTSSLRERPIPETRPSNFTLVDRRIPVRVLNALWHRTGAPSLDTLTHRAIDVAHSPTPLILPSRRGRSIVTIHDLFFLDHPGSTSAEIRRDYAALVRAHSRRAAAVVTNSETTAREVMERLDVPPERITVIHAGVDARFLDGSTTTDGGPPFLLTVATEEPRKNLPLAIEAVSLLKKRGWDGRLKIAGGPGSATTVVGETIDRLGVSEQVERLGYVNDETLSSLYREARAVVLPSRWEGFGLPLLEAMASGSPVVATDIPAHREVAGPAALFVSPDEGRFMADAVERLWHDEALRERLAARGRERLALFSWEESARKAMALYQRLGRAE